MARSALIALALAFCLPAALADRGLSVHHPPSGIHETTPDQPLTEDLTVMGYPSAATAPVTTLVAVKRNNETLQKRNTPRMTYAESCEAAIPAGSAFRRAPGFDTMGDVLDRAFSDALTLATAGNTLVQSHPAFTHYFGGPNVDTQRTHFRDMMYNVADATTNSFDIEFECAQVSDCSNSTNRGSVMVTDATVGPGQKTIQVCPLFWTSRTSMYFLYDRERTSPSPPFRSNARDQWCARRANGNAANRADFFSTAGHSVLHELTHLDQLAALVGLEPDVEGRHGTLDAQDGYEMRGAREYLADYIANPELAGPDDNAESYAAAATEIFFSNLCEFREIPR